MEKIYICMLYRKCNIKSEYFDNLSEIICEGVIKCFHDETIAYNYALNEFKNYDIYNLEYFNKILYSKRINNKEKIIRIRELIETTSEIPDNIYFYDIICEDII